MTPEVELNKLKQLKIVRHFYTKNQYEKNNEHLINKERGRGGYHAESAVLLENNVVRKKYKKDKEGKKLFKQEVSILKQVKGCKFAANLINYDKRDLAIYMSYCGEPVPQTEKNLQTIARMIKILREDYGVVRHHKGKPVLTISSSNAGIIGDQIYLFDLAGKSWQIK